ncbi:MAG TPA: sulfotransferase [Myxococcota bacterium]|nr:sulfotransferase [Myxococcota bacterium]
MQRSRSQRLPVRLYNAARRAWDAARGGAPRFEPERLLDDARRATGLDDFGAGGGAWREGLDVLCRAYDTESRLNPFGRFMVGGMLSGILQGRLRMARAFRDDPALGDAPVERPIFILGLPRTGTTALHFLMAQDPGRQVLEYWLAAAPGPRPPRDTWASDPRFEAAAQGLRLTYWLDPGLRAIHDLTPEGPEECRHLFLPSFVDHTFDANANIPSYTAWFDAQDMRPAYALHRDALRWIGSTSPGRPWVLKYPAHMRNLDALLAVYPDARFVMTHRDPAEVIPSVCSLVTGWRGIHEDVLDFEAVGRWQLELYASWVENAMRVRERLGEERFCDLHFHELVKDPIAAMGRLYDRFGLPLSEAAEAGMADWYREHPQGRHGGHRYRAEDYGLSEQAILDRFSRYTRAFDVGTEGPGPHGSG